MSNLTHIVMYSGGIGSFFCTKRVVEEIKKPHESVILLFADTLMEDEDLYRFLNRLPIFVNSSLSFPLSNFKSSSVNCENCSFSCFDCIAQFSIILKWRWPLFLVESMIPNIFK